ncbi:PREDICTED: endogenous retrovirus group FC1 Env polyprotein [Rhinopithecus bieti]|uniref:endogenous retrovirus group FC1 Env polyprotein n=1 Tax=Rhinopithecus bieti TaxID=61621 RepID=UPI00083C3299|nr:PREDICTED: endogenous retrovirus group FC1 Env polyprotein [Rhinopithecus bieti]
MAQLKIFRSYVRVVSGLFSLASDIKQQKKAISALADPGSKLQDSSNPFSWLTLVRGGAQVVQMTGIHNISRCFLCATLNRPPLVAVPLPSPFNSSNLTLSFPLPGRTLGEVPLFQDPLTQQLPFCYSTPNASWCNRTGSAPLNLTAPPGGYFWCNSTLLKTLKASNTTLCVPISLIPSLTLYSEAELSSLLPLACSRQARAVFLSLMIGVSLASSLVASGLGTGALTHSVQTSQDLSAQLQVAIEASAESLASLQQQITSVAQVAAQNCRALDLLTADKGGTCMFLNEECCYYISESGLVETNLLTLEKIQEGLHQKNLGSGPSLGWWQSSMAGWVLPFLSPLLIIGFLLLIALCVLCFMQDRMKEVSRVTFNQMLLHPYTQDLT